MKISIVAFFTFVLSNLSYSQIDTTNWYPLQIGNMWLYSYGLEDVHFYSNEVVGDTIMPNGKHYYIINDYRYYRNDENKFVYEYNSSDSTESVLYDFISKDSTFWNVPYENSFWGIQVTKKEYNYYLDKYTNFKYFDWVEIDSSINGIDTIWNARIDVYPTRIAQGIGVTEYNYNNYPGSGGLIGAIINGDTLGTITNVNENRVILNDYKVYQNYPNPFNPETNIEFTIPIREYVELNIYNSLGQKVKVLLNKVVSNGNHNIKFNGSNFPSGIYFYQLKTKKFIKVMKMLLIK